MTPGSDDPLSYTFDASDNLETLPSGSSASYDDASELDGYSYDADGNRIETGDYVLGFELQFPYEVPPKYISVVSR